MKKKGYKIDFSIDNLNMYRQQKIYDTLISSLDYNEKENLHITITDTIGGKHFSWENKGVDPNGIECNKCNFFNCLECPTYLRRIKEKEEKK